MKLANATSCLLFPLFVHGDAGPCEANSFERSLPSYARLISAQSYGPNTTFRPPKGDVGFPGVPTHLPPYCAVEVNITTSPSSASASALWLPAQWSGRFLAVGNAAFAGGLNYLDIGVGIQYGFASMTTDTGHSSNQTQTQWALNQPEKRADWGYRAMHMSVDLAKNLTQLYYGTASHHSYFSGCSSGGRQGLKQAEVDPESFDGLLIGAPAWSLEHLQPASVAVALPNLPASRPKHIPQPLFSVIGAEVYRQCDSIDGVKDGIIMNPAQCRFDPAPLLCTPTSNASTCLTAAQITTLRSFYTPTLGAAGEVLWPPYPHGAEYQWYFLLSGNAPSPIGTGWIRDFLLNDPDWNYTTYSNDLIYLADQPATQNSTGSASPNGFDLIPYRNRGGKVLHYHGYSDGLVFPQSSFIYYERVKLATSSLLSFLLPSSSRTQHQKQKLDEWYRLFPIPGMSHCFTSPAAVNASWYIAGAQQAGFLTPPGTYSVPGYSDPQHDSLLALVEWVEKEKAPDSLIATKFVNDSVPMGMQRQRPICPVPRQANYRGTGDVDDASSWECSDERGWKPWISWLFELLELF